MTKSYLVATLSLMPLCMYAQKSSPDTLTQKRASLKTVVVDGSRSQRNTQMKTSQSVVSVGSDYIESHLGGSLMQSLEQIPGVKAMSVGSAESKPTIRGLGFNRMVVAENGIKHEGQQWGEDHGLEINQFDVDRVEVMKGPSALLYGSDAIGGVINVFSDNIPNKSLEGKAQLFGRSNNASIGASLRLGGRGSKGWFWKAAAAYTDYADYRVPTDSIQYHSYYIKLHKGRLRNTAGRDLSMSGTVGYKSERLTNQLRVSNTTAKSGFFANAHGLEVRLSTIDYDASERDIDLPYHWVNHLKVSNHTLLHLDDWHLSADLSYQRNVREEQSEPVSHGYMPKPSSTLERRFTKDTYTLGLGAKRLVADRHNLSVGASTEYQHNRRDGWGFIIPDFNNLTAGAYAYDRFYVQPNLILTAGLRYDWTRTQIYGYRDWYKSPTESGDSLYKERAADRTLRFGSLTWAVGVNYNEGAWMLKANVGKGFRTPIAKELGTDGVNYHIFRYEKGNADLKPEESYQIDASIGWSKGTVALTIDPYLNYFSNYIYMNPTSTYYEGLQLYTYEQARVMRWGLEAQVKWTPVKWMETTIDGEYLYARQLSGDKKGYTLPFSQPWSISATAKVKSEDSRTYAALNFRYTGAQNEVVPPEEPTPAWWVLGASAGHCFHLRDCALTLSLQAQNLLNRRYYDHTSYYRLISVPEPGRNVAVVMAATF